MRSEASVGVLPRNHFFWAVILCCLVSYLWSFEGLSAYLGWSLNTEGEGTTVLRNNAPCDTALRLRNNTPCDTALRLRNNTPCDTALCLRNNTPCDTVLRLRRPGFSNNWNCRRIQSCLPVYTVMCHLRKGMHSEKCVVRRFGRCANVIECTYTSSLLHT